MSTECRFCGQEIPEGRQFCSLSCRNRANGQKLRAKTGVQVCLYCGKEFYRHPCEIAKGSVKYCSRVCCNTYVAEHGRPDRKVVSKTCKNCGKVFTIPNCWLKKTKNAGQYCSMACWHEIVRQRGTVFGVSKRAKWGEGTGVYTDSHGYIHEYDPVRHKFVRQHRLVMERMLGRLLEKWESVHHKNGKRADNDPENLELFIGNHFSGKRVRDIYAQDIERLALENLELKRKLKELQE